jgi:Zn-dependent metalloprotease
MLNAADLTIHEMTHDVIKHTNGAEGGTNDQAGSVNEGLADVMAASATRDWKLGEQMYQPDSYYRYMRNIADPTDPRAVMPLWTSMNQYRQAQQAGAVEPHYASGIISNAAYRMQARIGGEAGWQAIQQLFYQTIANNRLGDMSFESTAQGLRYTAAQMWGENSADTQIVNQELANSGL